MFVPVGIAIAITIVVSILSPMIPNLNIMSIITNSYVEMFLSFAGVYLTIAIITRNNWSKLKLSFKGKINKFWVLGTTVFAMGLHIIVSEIDNLVQHFVPMTGSWLETFQALGELPIITYILLVVVTAPIVEELFLRGVIAKGLSNRYSQNKAIVFTALLFGLVHMNIWQFVAAFLGGLFLSWLYLSSNALVLSILAHAIHNGMSVIADLMGIEIMGYNIVTATGFVHQPLWFDLIGLLLMGIGVYLFKKAKRQNAEQPNPNDINDIFLV